MKTRTGMHCKVERVDFSFVQEACGILTLIKNAGSILITPRGVMLGLSPLNGCLSGFLHLDLES